MGTSRSAFDDTSRMERVESRTRHMPNGANRPGLAPPTAPAGTPRPAEDT